MGSHRPKISAKFNKIICIVLDGVGVGAAPDAASFGDAASDSLGNTARFVGSVRLPTLGAMGLGNLTTIDGVPPRERTLAWHGRMAPRSAGKDSTSGHWELMGCVVEEPFPVYERGFPRKVIAEFERLIGRRVIGNTPASGTQIIQELGGAHVKTGRPIVYTSQDSVFQIAAHESVIPPAELYRFCEIARSILTGPHAVARVIARPFAGESGGFYRTSGRRDFSLPPVAPTVLDALHGSGTPVLAIGKIHDLFCGRGIDRHVPTRSNREGIDATLDAASAPEWPFVFTNLIDFDMMWGHRNDARAYALGLEEFDSCLPALLDRLGEDALVVITSDHGNDPTTPSTDHSREYVPLIVHHRGLCAPAAGRSLGTRGTLSDVGRTVAENFRIRDRFPGESFLRNLIE
jgi:phosphopentomutase